MKRKPYERKQILMRDRWKERKKKRGQEWKKESEKDRKIKGIKVKRKMTETEN